MDYELQTRLRATEHMRIIVSDYGHDAATDVLREIALAYLRHVLDAEGRAAFDELIAKRLSRYLVHLDSENPKPRLVWSKPLAIGGAA